MPLQATLSPALETALDYYLRVLAISISYAGPALLNYREELKHVIMSAFQAPSWKVYIPYIFIHLDRQYTLYFAF
jgi:proteasome activator subunit 4